MKVLAAVLILVSSSIFDIANTTVDSLVSSQTDSQEEFVCSNEHLSYTCELSGNLLIWTLKGMSSSGGESYISNNLTFGSSDPVGHAAFNTPPTELEAVAFLIRNIDGKLRSALFLTYAPTIFGDTISSIVQCSSRNDSDTIWIGTAAVPDKPTITQAKPIAHINERLIDYHLIWSPPENINKTDIRHYILKAGMKNHTIHSSLKEAIIEINLEADVMYIHMLAIDRCNREGKMETKMISSSGYNQIYLLLMLILLTISYVIV